jgi:RNA polymerase sigma factor (TIGR02999 family)
VDPSRTSNTDTLLAAADGDAPAAARLMPCVYDELRSLARHYFTGERAGHTLQPTALVHEAYLRMVDLTRIDWKGKTHFFAIAARQMRRILVDHARARGTAKRGSGRAELTLNEEFMAKPYPLDDLIALDQALERLGEFDARAAQVVELKLFAGLTAKEAGAELGVSERTVRDDWNFGRAWVLRELGGDTEAS